MKRIVSCVFLSFAVLLSATACSNNEQSSESSPVEVVQTAEPIQLTNRMTETELARVNKHGVTLLDAPEETATSETEPELTEHIVSVEFEIIPNDELISQLEERHEELSDEEYQRAMEELQPFIESGEDYKNPAYILVDGVLCRRYIPSSDPGYDGGEISIYTSSYNDETGETELVSLSFADFDEYLDWIRESDTEYGYSEDWIENDILRVQIADEAFKTGDYETLPEGTVDVTDDSLYDDPGEETKNADYRDVWEYDRDAVEAIKDSIDEINIYDEELDTEFLVHVTLPPNYDKSKTYPVFFLTDGVWRFGNHTELRKVMENSESADVVLVSLGYNYNMDGTDDYNRFTYFIQKRDMLLDFITDNLMPYLGENYNIDYANSTLYGHSNGGVFTHNALFKSDLYENQPFGNYIIGSPAFWNLYLEDFDLDSEGYINDYGYFDRNKTLCKKVFLCGGTLEDPDYTEYYNGHDTTLEGLAKLNDRLEAHDADVTYKLYESHHYQYIPEMLIEYLKKAYPIN
ncbi:MAG: alpha/beta hydrolase [Ruminococcus sp.]